jgi:hypothetical protein
MLKIQIHAAGIFRVRDWLWEDWLFAVLSTFGGWRKKAVGRNLTIFVGA